MDGLVRTHLDRGSPPPRSPEAERPVSRRSRSNDTTDDGAERKSRSLKPLLALKPYLLAYPSHLAAAGLALIVSSAAMLSVPLAVRRMIDNGFVAGDGGFIGRYFLMLIVIGAVLAVASSSRAYFVNWLGERVVANLRADVFRHLARLGASFHEKNVSGELLSRLSADTTQLKGAAGSAISQAVRNLIMLIGALAMMLVTSPRLSLLVLVAIPAIVLPLVAYGRSVRKLSRAAQDRLAEASAFAGDNLAHVRTMQAYTNETNVGDRFRGAVEAAFDAARDRLKARAFLTATAVFLSIASVVGVLWYGASLVVAGEITGGRLSQFVLYSLFAAGALAELSEVWGEVSQAAGAAERLSEILAVVPDIRSPDRPVPLPLPPQGEITFDTVSFCYPARPDRPALDGVSFRIAPGETVALVGPSGAGKSTILNLILRMHDATAGTVRIDGVDVRDADLDALRRRMALVAQDLSLFADTVAENIRYGAPEADQAAVARAADAAQATEFIRLLPQGFETPVGERGVTLSGGQRQRIALARAILRNAPILLLDEATSALDAENEIAVQRALEGVMRNRTTLVIAHRLATVKKAGRILVIDKGRIVEEGTHDTLLAKGGLYARLAAMQFGVGERSAAAE
jgi:ATP-binding cassette subfamily B protein